MVYQTCRIFQVGGICKILLNIVLFLLLTFHMSHQAVPTTTTTNSREMRIVRKAISPSLIDILHLPPTTENRKSQQNTGLAGQAVAFQASRKSLKFSFHVHIDNYKYKSV